ncbi:zinc finger, CCHC-type containing protein [Tanacetum coccineum]
MKVDGTIDKFKARLVLQGFRQKEGIDYFDTYAPVARITTIRSLLALAAIHNLVIHQMDVKTTFLNGDLEEKLYMKQPEGFVMLGNEHKVCKLVKSLYGMKQAPKKWHQKFDEVVLSSGFLLNQSDKFVYRKFDSSVGRLSRFDKTNTRPDIAYVVGRLSRFTSNPSRQNWQAITRMLAGNHVKDLSSTSRWVFLLRGGAISWASKKKTCITDFTMESEFVALVAVGKEAEWLRNMIHEIPIWLKPIAPISIRCDNAPKMAKAYSQIYNGKSSVTPPDGAWTEYVSEGVTSS